MVEFKTHDFLGGLGENVGTVTGTTAGVVDASIRETFGNPLVSAYVVFLDLI